MIEPDLRIWIDGREVSRTEAGLDVLDRGWLHGDSVFETLRSHHGVPFGPARHLERLARGLAALRITTPELEVLEQELREAARALGDGALLRLAVTRGSGPLGLSLAGVGPPVRVLLAVPRPPLQWSETPVRARVVPGGHPLRGSLAARAKVAHYVPALLALAAARDLGAEEALLEEAGQVRSAAAANLFAVVGGTLVTAPDDGRILPGVTRSFVLELAAAAGVPVEQRALDRGELGALDEAFVTSSVRGLAALAAIDDQPLRAQAPGPVTRRLRREYRALVARSCGIFAAAGAV